MKWINDGYEIELIGNEENFYCSIIVDNKEYTKFYPDYTEGKSCYEEYLEDFGSDLFRSIDIHQNRLWIPLYCIRKIDINDIWAEYDDVFSTHSRKDAEKTFNTLTAPKGYKLVLIRLDEPVDFNINSEPDYDKFTLISEK